MGGLLVTGRAGFIGLYLVERSLAKDETAVGRDKDSNLWR